jgi:hypothetical protein
LECQLEHEAKAGGYSSTYKFLANRGVEIGAIKYALRRVSFSLAKKVRTDHEIDSGFQRFAWYREIGWPHPHLAHVTKATQRELGVVFGRYPLEDWKCDVFL